MKFCLITLMVVAVCGQDEIRQIPSTVGLMTKKIDILNEDSENTELVQAFVVFRHGDRTPDQEELDKFPADVKNDNVFFPYGKKALTNKGKQRGYLVGEYLRRRYGNFISNLYLPDEVSIRTTAFARTMMTALTALAALYAPPPAQKWNPLLNWQPVPYNTMAMKDDDLMYYYNCPRYLQVKNAVYDLPEFKETLKSYEGFFNFLTSKTGSNITNPEDVFFLDNLFQTLENVGISPPKWAQQVMPKIKENTKVEYASEFYTSEEIRLSSGVLLTDILEAARSVIAGEKDRPKLYLISAHENNVGGLMAAARVFKPHQPKYGSTISLELRRRPTGQYGFMAVYAANAGGPAEVLPISGCGGQAFCDYNTFVELTRENTLQRSEFKTLCNS